jgi:CheY-like chemotaxis protein
MERRKQPRARLNPKEGATVTALTGLFEGIGVNGVLESISESGCRLRVEKALNLKDEKRLHLGTALLSPGQPFMLLKLNKVPKCPAVMELSGKLAYLSDTSGGLAMAIIFEKPRADFASAIRALVSSRASAVPTSVPPKARRKAPSTDPSMLGGPGPRAGRTRGEEESATQEKDTAPAPEAFPVEETSKPRAAPETPVEKVSDPPRNPALLRLKKRARTVVLLTSAGYGALLKGYLQDEGYGQVILAANPQELANALALSGIALVVIDSSAPILESLEMVAQLHEANPDLPPFILAAEDVSRALVMAAHRSGVSQLLVKPYPLDETFSALLEQQMGLL